MKKERSDEDKVIFRCANNDTFETSWRVVKISETIRGLAEDTQEPLEVYVPHLTSNLVSHVFILLYR